MIVRKEAMTIHQLIVIGNGFDLACVLPSRYKNFDDSRTEFLKFEDCRLEIWPTKKSKRHWQR